MLFHFLGFALLECCLLSLVCANPMKEQLKVVGDATVASSSGSGPSSSSPRKPHPFRFSPYQKQQAPIPGTFRCPNGQAIDEKILTSSMANLCQMSKTELSSRNIKVSKLFFDKRYISFVYPINPDGSVVQESASKDSSTQYEILIDQDKKPPFKCSLGGVFFKVQEEILYCVHIPQLHKPLNPAIFQKESNSIFDCNGEHFKPHQVYLSMLAAKDAYHEKFYGSKKSEGFPYSFQSGVFTVEDLWKFPIIPGENSVYKAGKSYPGKYSVIITGTGMPVGVVYIRTDEQYAQEIAIKRKSPSKEKISIYRVCKIRDYISID